MKVDTTNMRIMYINLDLCTTYIYNKYIVHVGPLSGRQNDKKLELTPIKIVLVCDQKAI